jgi:hypothetical protein
MADRVVPVVRLLFPCDEAICRLSDGKWVLTNPRTVLTVPSGVTFTVKVKEMWVYAQLTDGVGEFDLAIEMRYLQPDETRKVIGHGKPTRMDFRAGRQLQVFDMGFRLTKVPFKEPGMYEFAVVTVSPELPSQTVPLEGQTALFRVLDSRDKL